MNFDVKDINTYLTVGMGSIFGALSWLIGGMDQLLITFVIFMTIDIITGWAKGAFNGKLSSEKGWKGIVKKLIFLLIFVAANLLDYTVNARGLIRGAFLSYGIGTEGISILENAAELGVPFPEILLNAFGNLKKSIKEIDIPILNSSNDIANETDKDEEV